MSTENRGFASMDEERQRAIASKGGKAAHERGTAHEFTSEEARTAGQKGGQTVSQDRQHMADIGRAGGKARSQNSGHDSTNITKNSMNMSDNTPDNSLDLSDEER